MTRTTRAAALAILAVALPASAIQPIGRPRVVADPPGWRLDALWGPEATRMLSPAARAELAALEWEALVDPASALPVRAWGPPAAAGEGALAFLAKRPALLGFRPGFDGYALVPRAPFRAGPTTVVVLDQLWNGFPVEGVRADVRLRDGYAVMARLHLARGIDAATAPQIPEARALALARAAIAGAGLTPSTEPRLQEKRPLAIVRHGDSWRLAWVVRIDADAPPARLTVWIDALDGAVIAVRDEVRRGAVVTPLSLEVWHEPRRAGDVEVLSPLPFFAARDGQEAFVTDTAGEALIPVLGSSRVLSLGLEGDFVSVILWNGSSAAAVQVDAGVPQSFVWDAQSASLPERDAAISHAIVRTRMKRMAPDLAWLDERIGIIADIPDAEGCNAFWDGDTAQFYAESDTCNATARVADVVYHEIGHGFHQNLAVGGSPPGDIAEGSADYLAATVNGDPDIAPSFFKDSPEGLRNLEPDLVFPDDLVDESHLDGLIWGGAFWDLRKALVATHGTDQGVVLADLIFADTLRFNPAMEDGFWDAVFAADDDGNLSNGGPYECAIVEAFGAHGLGPGNGLGVSHLPLGQQSPSAAGYRVRAHIASAFPRCGATGVGTSELQWRRAGEIAWQALPMGADLVPGWRTAMIPAQPDGTIVEYRLRAVDSEGVVATSPSALFDLQPFRFSVSDPEVVFADDFETDRGWTHALVEGNDIIGADDWQRGTPLGRSGDPHYAFSGAFVWGNDLGEDPFNGAYQPNVHNRLESPAIDCRRCAGTRLQFRRWLGAEASAYDVASVWVNERKVWTNPPGDRTRDREWRFEDVDISAAGDGKTFRLRFELESNTGIQLGGWNLDDVTITRDGDYEEPGSCSCALGRTPSIPWGGFVVAALALGAVFRSRRR